MGLSHSFSCARRSLSSSGFTLIEILITIVIIAVLGVIAFVSFGGFRESAIDSKRLSDIENVTNSITTYIEIVGKAPTPSQPKNITY